MAAPASAPSPPPLFAAHFIHGQFCAPERGQYMPVLNPATEEVIGFAPLGAEEDVERAVQSARNTFDRQGSRAPPARRRAPLSLSLSYAHTCTRTPTYNPSSARSDEWSGIAGRERAKVLRAVAACVRARKPALAKLETANNGKPLKESEWDVDDVAGCFEYFAEQAEKLDERQNTSIKLPDDNFRCVMRYEPTGVVSAIIPWNYPLLMLAWKVAPALAAGCTMVLKPSELTPLTAHAMASVFEEAKVPPGVVNIVTGDGSTGALLSSHPMVDKVAFTGSVATGVRISHAAAPTVKNVTLELGGKSPILVFDDADLEKAVEWIMFGVFWTNGQICSSTSRLLVQNGIAERLLARLVEETKRIVIGDPNLEQHAALTGMLGPLVSGPQRDKVKGFVDQALREGAKLLAGGRVPPSLPRGFFFEPTILAVTPEMTIWREEVFGPVLSVVRFASEAEGLRLANDSKYGLAGAVITNDQERLQRIARGLRAGIVWQNCSQPAFTQAPWGGLKQSGVGRELGPHGIDNYLEPKQITTYVAANRFGWYPFASKL
jgi:betaine-aldehyde dehydrogenase